MLKNVFSVLFAFFLCLNGSLAHAEISFPEPPPTGSFIVDEAQLIDEGTEQRINDVAAKILKDEQAPIFVATIPSLQSYNASNESIETYATKLFNNWGIGYKDHSYGVLLLVSKGDRKARIELGSDYNHRYDAEAKEVMDRFIIPYFKQGNFAGGIESGVTRMDMVIRGLDLPKKPMSAESIIILVVIGIILIGTPFVIYSLFKSGKSGWGWAVLVAFGLFLWWLIRTILSGSSGRGGGRGGGGGASGSW